MNFSDRPKILVDYDDEGRSCCKTCGQRVEETKMAMIVSAQRCASEEDEGEGRRRGGTLLTALCPECALRNAPVGPEGLAKDELILVTTSFLRSLLHDSGLLSVILEHRGEEVAELLEPKSSGTEPVDSYEMTTSDEDDPDRWDWDWIFSGEPEE